MKNIAILIAVVGLAIGGLVYFGVISRQDVEQTGRKALYDAKGVAGKIVAPPSGVGADAAQAASICRENLKRIESAKRAAAEKKGIAVGSVAWSDVDPILGQRPQCPVGGRYSLNPVAMTPTCSISGNQTSDPSDDHIIRNF